MNHEQTALPITEDHSTIYLSVEVSRSSWVIGVYCPATDENIRTHKIKAAETRELYALALKAQHRAGMPTSLMLAYEAGYEGFWLARKLEVMAPEIEVVVLDPASLQVDRRYKKVKTDRLDAEKMIRALKAWHSGDRDALSRVPVPPEDVEDKRRLVRERDGLIAERIRCYGKIRGELQTLGIFHLGAGTRDLCAELSIAKTGYDTPVPPRAYAKIKRTVARLNLIREHIAEVEAELNELVALGKKADASTVEGLAATLVRVKGIGMVDATLLACEVYIRDFRNRRQVGSWAGLTSAPWSSGNMDRDQGITKTGPARVRSHLIQMAWRWLHHQPESKLSLWYRERTKDGQGRNRKKLIVALARKLLVALWQFAIRGVIPEGSIVQ